MDSASNSYTDHKWWKESTVYQIYPASFKSTGSGSVPGWGDIKGITSKLDYLKNLGVDILWLSPIYKSPQVDMGYDISDYNDIDPRYGKLADVDDLIAGLKQRGMKLMMDLVVNHTSNLHDWFLESRSSKQSPKRDWYIWQPPKYDDKGNRKPPNNWAMLLGKANSAWTWDDETQEYYLSLFTPEQPDLNWRNPAVREAVHDILRFWLDKGVSGFRMDVINLISKVEGYPDAEVVDPTIPYQPGHKLYANGPMLHEYLSEMNQKVLSKYDTITVGEMPFVGDDTEEILRIVAEDRKELNMIFIFELVDIDGDRWGLHEWTVGEMRDVVAKWQTIMREGGGWNSIFIENHDNPRSVSRYCDDSTEENRELGAKLLALMQTTLGGTLYLYQGEELGMKNFPLEWGVEEYKDVESLNYWKQIQDRYPDDAEKQQEAREILQRKARDHARTPVQWTAGPNAGFCEEGVKPWMRVNDDYETVNAEVQIDNTDRSHRSVYHFWQDCLKRRRAYKDILVYGTFKLLDSGKAESVIAYQMKSSKGTLVVVLNFSAKDASWMVPENVDFVEFNYDTPNVPSTASKGTQITLRPWEGVLGRVML